MASNTPIGLYGLEVPANEEPMHSFDGLDYPCTFRITMAALDPTAPPTGDGPIRATLKMIRVPRDDDEDEDDEEGLSLDDLLDQEDDDEDDDDEEVNGGPSDPSKSSKALKRAAFRKMLAEAGDDDMEIDELEKPKLNKGKGKAAPVDDEDDEDLDSDEDIEMEEFVLCTLNPETHYQQPLDITINEHESVLFQVTGSHNIHLTGNILLPARFNPSSLSDEADLYNSDEEDSELDDDEDDLDLLDGEDDSEDELDDLEDPRIEELSDEEVPKLVKGDSKAAAKNKKRPAEEEEVNGEDVAKLSKTQQKKLKKKLKDNAGNAVEVAAETVPNGIKASAKKEETPEKGEKKVQFAEKLVQGPTNGAAKKDEKKAGTGPRKVQGVEIDDKKIGTGPQAKNGDKVSMRYIGKLEKDKKVFDSNKKGAPFSFKLGAGQVIKGWDIGVAGMAAGGERRITIPAHLAYGSKGAPPQIPGNAVLTFDIKCLEVKK